MRARAVWMTLSSSLALVAPLSGSTVAHAGNGVHMRTPVVFNDVACSTMVDRVSGSTWQLSYDIPYEDTEVTADEVADSRRHQFFAFCRDNAPQDFIPNWVTWADVMAAADKDLIDPARIEDAQVLETNSAWAGCWHRINADDARLPITFANAEAGVPWDTAGIDAGGYVIFGYTWEPPFNLWIQRPGFVKVIDGDPDAVAPAVAITTGELVLYRDDTGIIEGCVDAIDGSTITALWARAQDDPQWSVLVEAQPVEGSGFVMEFPAPEDLAGDSGMLRVDVTDPMGRTTSAYGIELMIVLPGTNPDNCGGGGFVDNPGCAGDSGSDDGGDTAGDDVPGETDAVGSSDSGEVPRGDADAGSVDDGGGGRGCGCTSTPRAPHALWLAAIALGLRPRRRSLASRRA